MCSSAEDICHSDGVVSDEGVSVYVTVVHVWICGRIGCEAWCEWGASFTVSVYDVYGSRVDVWGGVAFAGSCVGSPYFAIGHLSLAVVWAVDAAVVIEFIIVVAPVVACVYVSVCVVDDCPSCSSNWTSPCGRVFGECYCASLCPHCSFELSTECPHVGWSMFSDRSWTALGKLFTFSCDVRFRSCEVLSSKEIVRFSSVLLLLLVWVLVGLCLLPVRNWWVPLLFRRKGVISLVVVFTLGVRRVTLLMWV